MLTCSLAKSLNQKKNPGEALMEIMKEKKLDNFLSIYTDGSRILDDDSASPKATSFAFFVPNNNYHYVARTNPNFSIMHAEACAIIYAIKYITNIGSKKSIILSDSRSTLLSLSSNDSKGNLDTTIYLIKHLLLDASKKDLTIHLMWIPSHIGILGNERADTLAKQALSLDHLFLKKIYINNSFPILKSNMINHGKNFLLNQSSTKGKVYFQMKKSSNILKDPWWTDLNLDRETISTISRLRSGHVRLNLHLFLKNIVEDPLCECGFLQDIDHAIFSCPLKKRYYGDDLLCKLWETGEEFSRDTREIAFSNSPRQCRFLVKHIDNFKINI